MRYELFRCARSNAVYRTNDGLLKPLNVHRPRLPNDRGGWPVAALVTPPFAKSDQEISSLFCIPCEKTVQAEIQDSRNQGTPKRARVPRSLEFIIQVAFDDQNLISVGLAYPERLVEKSPTK